MYFYLNLCCERKAFYYALILGDVNYLYPFQRYHSTLLSEVIV